MKSRSGLRSDGFALIVTITLVAMIALIVLGLAAISRVEIQAQENLGHAAAARRNAQFALALAVEQLARFSTDDVVTVRSDFLGGNPASPNWTGVVNPANGSVVVWLVNGAEQGISPDPFNTVAAPATRASSTVQLLKRALEAKEQVTVVKSELQTHHPALEQRVVTGRYAYWVSDESQKVSLAVPDGLPAPAGLARYPAPHADKILPGYTKGGERVERLVTTDQALLIGVKADDLNPIWPAVTSMSKGVTGPGMFALGAFNVNSRSTKAWTAVLGAVDEVNGSKDDVTTAIMSCERPFISLADFGTKFRAAFTEDPLLADQIIEMLTPVLTVRGDTFLVRAYGEAVNPLTTTSDPRYVLATAFCEARVQRTMLANGQVKYVTTYFRWLAGNDI